MLTYLLLLLPAVQQIQCFTTNTISSPTSFLTKSSSSITSCGTSLYMGTNRKSRRNNKKQQGQSRPNTFYDAMEDTGVKTKTKNKKNKQQTQQSDKPEEEEGEGGEGSGGGGAGGSVVSSGSVADAASANMDRRPDVSTVVVDEDTGIERIQQGKNVMDVVTRKAVKLSDLGPMYRLAQMFPGIPPDVRDKHRVDWSTIEIPELIERFRQASLVLMKNEETGEDYMDIPSFPQVSDNALDFVLANRDLMGPKMKKTLGRLKLRAQSQMDIEATREKRKVWKHFMTIEDSLSAPFRQIVLDAEGRVGPNFGNLDMSSFCGTELYERTASYIVLKGMVAHWEKKVRDAEYVESTPQNRGNFLDILMVGDPKRYLPDPPIIYRYTECIRIALMAQNMTSAFVDTPSLYDDLPPEVRFVESASFIKGGTGLREFMINDFCPKEGITPEALREGVRRFDVQLSNLQIDPYGDLKNVVGRLCDAIAVGTDDARDPYGSYLTNLDSDGPGYFQTYTTDFDRQSMVRFLDSAKEIQQGTIGPTDSVLDQLSNEASNLFGFGANDKPKPATENENLNQDSEEYSTPDPRACGRPHNLGWLNLLGDEELYGENSSKRNDLEEEEFESDNWREVIIKRQQV